MPAIARAEPDAMDLPALLRHVRAGALKWKIQYPPFWVAAFARLRELEAEIGPAEAVQLLEAMQPLRLVDMKVIVCCEHALETAGDEAFGLKVDKLVRTAESLVAMERHNALPGLLRLIIPRAHRLSVASSERLLSCVLPAAMRRTASCTAEEGDNKVGVPASTAALQLLDAMAREFSEASFEDSRRPNLLRSPAMLLTLVETAVAMLSDSNVAGAGRMPGLEQFFIYVARRVRSTPQDFETQLTSLLSASDQLSQYVPPMARRIFHEIKAASEATDAVGQDAVDGAIQC